MADQSQNLIIDKEFQAPRETIWAALTDPNKVKEWWSPDYFTVPTCELDVRPEGKMRIDMLGPDGTLYPTVGIYKEVVEPERLAYTNTPLDDAGNALFEVLQTYELSESDGITNLHLSAEVLWAGEDAAPYLDGMEAGLNQALGKLASLVS